LTRLLEQRRAALFALVVVLAAAGVWIVRGLPSAIFPSVTFPIVKVIADAGDEPAVRVIPTLTRPLEEAVRRVPGVRSVRSITSRGSAELSVDFAWGTDMQVALQRVQAETQRVKPDLPVGTRIDVEWMNPAAFPILGYALTGTHAPPHGGPGGVKDESQADLRALAEYTLKPALLRIPGVSQVQVQGGRDREFQVHLDPAALQGAGLSTDDVLQAIRDQDEVASAGLVERNHELYLALVDGRVDSVAGLGRIRVAVASGPPVPLSRLGTVKVADATSYVRTTAADFTSGVPGQPAVLVNVVRQPSANTVAIADAVKQLLHDQPDLLPKGVHWSTFYDQARFVAASVRGTWDAIVIGVGLAALVLLAFLRRLKPTLVAVVAIPVVVAIVAVPLGAAGQTVNLMTLAGVAAAIGLIADDAIVVIEHVAHHGELGACRATRELLPALVGSSLSTTVILLPFSLLSGVVGAFFRPLALTLALALVVSFLVAWLVVPAATGRMPPIRSKPPGRLYARFVGVLLDHPSLALLGTLGLVAGAAFAYRAVGTDFLPSMDEGAIILDYFSPPGTSLADTDAMLSQAEAALAKIPDVAGFSRRTGAELGFFVTEPNSGDYVIDLKPRGQRRPVDDVIDDIRARFAALEPAVDTDFGQVLEDQVGDLTGGEPQPIDVRIYGPDEAALQAKAREVAALVGQVPGVEDVFDGITIAGPALRVHVDSDAAARFGLSTDAVHAAIQPALTGTVVDQVRVGERMYDLRVFDEVGRDLGGFRLRTPSGALVPLSALARLTTGAPEAEIDREDLETYVGVTARLSGRDLGGAIADIEQALSRHLQLGPGMSIRFGGLYQQQQESFRELLYVLLAGLALVSIVVLFEFGDWRAPILVATSAVAVLSGVLGALVATGTTLDISSYVGAIMMVGIVGENAIFVIHEARGRLRAGDDVRAAWLAASRRRLRPVAMTVLATAAALAPLALAIGEGSQLVRPLAIAVIGGFLVSGPIVLFLLPALYAWLDPHGRLGGRAP